MNQIPTADAIRLGMLVEYLRGISSVSISLNGSFDELPDLNANFAASRYRVADVVGVIREVTGTLEEFDLKETLGVIGDLREKLGEMETFLQETSAPDEAFLLDRFANDLIVIANEIGDKLIEEVSATAPS